MQHAVYKITGKVIPVMVVLLLCATASFSQPPTKFVFKYTFIIYTYPSHIDTILKKDSLPVPPLKTRYVIYSATPLSEAEVENIKACIQEAKKNKAIQCDDADKYFISVEI